MRRPTFYGFKKTWQLRLPGCGSNRKVIAGLVVISDEIRKIEFMIPKTEC